MARKRNRKTGVRRPKTNRRKRGGNRRVAGPVVDPRTAGGWPTLAESAAVVKRPHKGGGFFKKLASGGIDALAGVAKKVLLGQGDYKEVVSPAPGDLNVNSLVKPLVQSDVPFMHNTNDWIRITRREYIGDVGMVPTATDNAAQPRHVLNPGDAGTFPWMHNIARNYKQWLPLGICFEYVPTCGTGIATTPNVGVIRMATQYDVYEPVFGADFPRILNHFFASSGAPYNAITHCIECAPNQTPIRPLFIRSEESLEHRDVEKKTGGIDLTLSEDATFDARLYDLGRFEMNNSGSVAPYTAGQMWISYDIVLLKPKLAQRGGITYDSDFIVPLPDPPVLTLRNEVTVAVTDASAALIPVGP
jgi:hypothetical protein